MVKFKDKEMDKMFKRNERDKIISTFGKGTTKRNIVVIDNGWNYKNYNSNHGDWKSIIKILLKGITSTTNYYNNKNNWQPTSDCVFEEHNTTKHNHKHHQIHNTIQDLKFGIYLLVVWFRTQLSWQSNQTQPTLANYQQTKTQSTKISTTTKLNH